MKGDPMRSVLMALLLAGCASGPPDANHPVLWWVGGTAGLLLLSAAWWMLEGTLRRHDRREDREDRRDDRREPKK